MNDIIKTKKFPAFNRLLYGNPQKLFEDWAYDDFVKLPTIKGLFNAPNLAEIESTDGWIIQTAKGTAWGMFLDEYGAPIKIFPWGINKVLFPHNIKLSKRHGVTFVDNIKTNDSNLYAEKYFYPPELLYRAMLNVGLPLGQALLLEAFTGSYTPKDVVDSPSLVLDAKIEGIEDMPFTVLEEILLSLCDDENAPEKFSQGRYQIFRLATQLYEKGDKI